MYFGALIYEDHHSHTGTSAVHTRHLQFRQHGLRSRPLGRSGSEIRSCFEGGWYSYSLTIQPCGLLHENRQRRWRDRSVSYAAFPERNDLRSSRQSGDPSRPEWKARWSRGAVRESTGASSRWCAGTAESWNVLCTWEWDRKSISAPDGRGGQGTRFRRTVCRSERSWARR